MFSLTIKSLFKFLLSTRSLQEFPIFLCLIPCYRTCLSPTCLPCQIPGDRLNLLSPTTSPAVALPGFRLPVPVAVWRSPSMTLLPSSLIIHVSPTICLPAPSLTGHPVPYSLSQRRRVLPLRHTPMGPRFQVDLQSVDPEDPGHRGVWQGLSYL